MPHRKCHASVEGHREPMMALHRAEEGRVSLEGPMHSQGQGAWGLNAEEEESRVTQVCGMGVGGRWWCDVPRQRQREKKLGHL